ncbi:unnamed protein product [Adineta steineri]|uniref:Uncharacterized protein n=1 Tax=Adineta steineri TaxID=433720 RepID=A0A814ZCZ6_9BILA|nr:unnamed protein product [Adineta steineri]CAF1241203.1 unnamed protein product [Adineta steineri]CAF3527567.1 unnamed protein product [Adineta steineri]CAF3740000.1 unnamed protein product [Adineta steineri]
MAEPVNLSSDSTPDYSIDRRFGDFSDHVTVWIDKHIGTENTYESIKTKFHDNIQVLQSNNPTENEIDDESMLCADQAMLKKLSDQVYCLKYFSTPEKGLEYIRTNSKKKIFFISSGTIGKTVVPEIADLPQIQGIYIFCGDISKHTEWAIDYTTQISAMLEHQDDLLERLTRDIALYLETKGDQHKNEQGLLEARNCYAWAIKLLKRGKMLGDNNTAKSVDRITKKLEEAHSSTICPSEG